MNLSDGYLTIIIALGFWVMVFVVIAFVAGAWLF